MFDLTLDRIKALSERFGKASEYMVITSIENDVAVGYRAYKRTVETISHGINFEMECDCEDYQYNFDLHDGFCKHVMAVLIFKGQNPVIVQFPSKDRLKQSEDLEAKLKELY